MTRLDLHFPRDLARLRSMSLLIGGACAILCLVAAITAPRFFFPAYLSAWLFCLALTLGSLAIVMLHHTVGGEWGRPIRSIAEAAMMTLPVLALAMIPILLGRHWLYPWARADLLDHDATLQHQAKWLNLNFVILRAIIYFAVWIGLAFVLSTWSLRYQQTDDPNLARRMRKVSAVGILLYGITMSLASVDWIMSREAHWYSTIFGFITLVGQTCTGLVFVLCILWFIAGRPELDRFLRANILNDLGNLFLTLIILWAYMSFVQFLVVWMGNLEHEVTWYVRRGLGADPNGWRFVALALVAIHFFLPFLLLLSRWTKRHLDVLSGLAALILLLRYLDILWTSRPSSLTETGRINWVDPFAFLALFGLWLFLVIGFLQRRPLLMHPEEEPETANTVTGEPGRATGTH